MLGKATNPQLRTLAFGLFSLMMASMIAWRSIEYISASRTFGSLRGAESRLNHRASKYAPSLPLAWTPGVLPPLADSAVPYHLSFGTRTAWSWLQDFRIHGPPEKGMLS